MSSGTPSLRTSGIVCTLHPDAERRAALYSVLVDDPRVTVGPLHGAKLPLAVEYASRADEEGPLEGARESTPPSPSCTWSFTTPRTSKSVRTLREIRHDAFETRAHPKCRAHRGRSGCSG